MPKKQLKRIKNLQVGSLKREISNLIKTGLFPKIIVQGKRGIINRLTIPSLILTFFLAILVSGSATSVAYADNSLITLFGTVTDEKGIPIPNSTVTVFISSDSSFIANTLTDIGGNYELNVPADPLYTFFVDGKQGGDPSPCRYIPIYGETRSLLKTEDAQINFRLKAGANLVIQAYDNNGIMLRNNELPRIANNSLYATDLNEIPNYAVLNIDGIQENPSQQVNRDTSTPAFVVLPEASYEIKILWEIPGLGKSILTADNGGQGYSVGKQGGQLVLNFNYEAAKSNLINFQRDYEELKSEMYQFSDSVADSLLSGQDHLAAAEKHLTQATPDMKNAVTELNLVLKATISAHEQLFLDKANADIERYRKGEVTIKAVDAAGKPLDGCDLSFKQSSHDFDFAVASSSHDSNQQYTELLKQAGINTKYVYFSYGEVQPEPGKFDWSGPDNQVDLQLKQGFKLIGDLGWFFYRANWGSPSACPTYLDNMSFDQIKENVFSYTYAVAERYTGKINIWESISEPCMFNQFNWTWNQKFEIYNVTASAIKKANPEATILSWNPSLSYQLQSYYKPEDINLDEPAPGLPWESVSDGLPYQEFIRLAMDYGVPIDLIGLHLENSGVNAYTQPMNYNVALDLVSISNMIDQYSSYGKPIFYRENQAPSTQVEGGNWWHGTWNEQTQAEYVKSFYTLAFGKPLMYGAGWSTGFADDDSYAAGAINGGLLNSDLTPKQAYYTLQELISSWTTSASGKTDQSGEFKLRGFAGDYAVSLKTVDGQTMDYTIHINEQKSAAFTITVPAATKTTSSITPKTETSSQIPSTTANQQPATEPENQISDSKNSILLILIVPAVLVVGFSILFFTKRKITDCVKK
ncbi:MAG: hypothetical protein ACQCN4_14075 [Candidatus Bathyarchaeia archaeon]